jgi:phosphoribosylglycinamide formyltransferase 1
MRVAVLASGNGSNLQSLLEHVRAGHVGAEVVCAVSDRPGSPALERARAAGVEAVALPPQEGERRLAYDARLLDLLRPHRPDLVVLAGYLRLVGPTLLAAFPQRIVNIHPSLLPAFKGLGAVRQALEAGVAFAGCTTHVVTEDLDGGPILLQAAVAVRRDETEAELQRRVLRLEHLLLPRTVELFAQGRIAGEGRRARIAPGDSWLRRPGIALAAGALYGEGF